jgi:hypothetical protein
MAQCHAKGAVHSTVSIGGKMCADEFSITIEIRVAATDPPPPGFLGHLGGVMALRGGE